MPTKRGHWASVLRTCADLRVSDTSAWSLCIDCRRVRSPGNGASVFSSERSGVAPQRAEIRADVEVDGAQVGFKQPADFVPLLGSGKIDRQAARAEARL